MASPKGFLLYKIYYGDHVAYVGRTAQTLQQRIRGHMFAKPMHRVININHVSKIEYTECKTKADMYLYEIYYINKIKPPLNVDDKADDELTLELPNLEWKEFIPSKWEQWKQELSETTLCKWHKTKDNKLSRIWDLE